MNDTAYDLNKIIRDEYQRKLGHLYDDLVVLLYGSGDKSMDRSDLMKLCAQYGEDNVREMMGVIAEDQNMQWEDQ